MVYGIIGMINFAHGEVYMVSAYLCAIGLALLSFFGIHPFPLLIFATPGVPLIVVTGVYGWAIERIAYRPLRELDAAGAADLGYRDVADPAELCPAGARAEPAGDPDAA